MTIYRCEARADPLPNITWTARDQRNDEIILDNSLNGISIGELTVKGSSVTSELTISKSLNFNVPTCTAMNMFGNSSLPGNHFIIDGTSKPSLDALASEFYYKQERVFL